MEASREELNAVNLENRQKTPSEHSTGAPASASGAALAGRDVTVDYTGQESGSDDEMNVESIIQAPPIRLVLKNMDDVDKRRKEKGKQKERDTPSMGSKSTELFSEERASMDRFVTRRASGSSPRFHPYPSPSPKSTTHRSGSKSRSRSRSKASTVTAKSDGDNKVSNRDKPLRAITDWQAFTLRESCWLCKYALTEESPLVAEDYYAVVKVMHEFIGKMRLREIAHLMSETQIRRIYAPMQRNGEKVEMLTPAMAYAHILCHVGDPRIKIEVWKEKMEGKLIHLMDEEKEYNPLSRTFKTRKDQHRMVMETFDKMVRLWTINPKDCNGYVPEWSIDDDKRGRLASTQRMFKTGNVVRSRSIYKTEV